MNKAERLALAGAVAPYFREQATAAAERRVARVDKDGKVVGYTTLAKVQQALLEKHKIEIAVQPDVRPKEIVCEKCGNPRKVTGTRIPKLCVSCAQGFCRVCQKLLGKSKKAKKDRATKCKSCTLATKRKRCPCGLPTKHRRAKYCAVCWPASQVQTQSTRSMPVCCICAAPVNRQAASASSVTRRRGQPPRCRSCAQKAKLK